MAIRHPFATCFCHPSVPAPISHSTYYSGVCRGCEFGGPSGCIRDELVSNNLRAGLNGSSRIAYRLTVNAQLPPVICRFQPRETLYCVARLFGLSVRSVCAPQLRAGRTRPPSPCPSGLHNRGAPHSSVANTGRAAGGPPQISLATTRAKSRLTC